MSANVDKCCINCIHSNGEFDGCFCAKKGSVSPDKICRRYKLDLLKLKPRPPLNLSTSQRRIDI